MIFAQADFVNVHQHCCRKFLLRLGGRFRKTAPKRETSTRCNAENDSELCGERGNYPRLSLLFRAENHTGVYVCCVWREAICCEDVDSATVSAPLNIMAVAITHRALIRRTSRKPLFSS